MEVALRAIWLRYYDFGDRRRCSCAVAVCRLLGLTIRALLVALILVEGMCHLSSEVAEEKSTQRQNSRPI